MGDYSLNREFWAREGARSLREGRTRKRTPLWGVRFERERGRLALVGGCCGRVAHTPLAVQLNEFRHDCFLGVEAVFGFVEDDALWAV